LRHRADKKADRAALIGVVGNLILTAFKLLSGILSGSLAVVGDSLHSFSDLLASGLVYFGIRKSREPPDHEHPFGHGDVEAVVGLLIAISLAIIAYELGRRSLVALLSSAPSSIGFLALVAAAVSAVTKELMARYTFSVSKETRSLALEANAWDHRADAISSTIILVGVAFAFFGLPRLDPVLALGMALLIGFVGARIGKKNIDNLIGTVPDPSLVKRIERIALSLPQVRGVHNVRIHYFGSYAEVDLHAIMDPSMSIETSHKVTDQIIERLKADLPEFAFVNIHVEPR